MWERRAPLTPSHCARLLLGGGKNGPRVNRIIVQPSTRRIHHDAQYEDAGCEISEDLSECGLIIGIKQPKLQMILSDRAYAFFSHTHKAQKENMPLLDKILEERVSLFDYELIVGDDGKRSLAFGKFAGRAGLIDFLHGLGQRYLSLGYSTPFLSLGQSHMYPSLAAAKAAVIVVAEEIATFGLPSGICPIVFVFTGRVCRPAAEFLASYPDICTYGVDDHDADQIHVIVASLYQKDAEETVDGIENTTATQLDVADIGSLSDLVSQVEVVISLLPASFHAAIAGVCIELKKHMVTASYVDESMSNLSQAAKDAGVTILCEMGLDPGIDHLMSMKMIDEAHARKGKIKAFTSYCGGLPSPAAANNPLAYKFSWNPAGALRSGKNPAVYKFLGETIHVDGHNLYESAKRLRLRELPAFALEHLPNRNSLIYGDLYGISKEASTIYRATLRYEGFSEIMVTLSKTGFFDAANHPLLQDTSRPTYKGFLDELLNNISTINTDLDIEASGGYDDDLIARLLKLGCCKNKEIAVKTVKTIKFLGLHEETQIPKGCSSPFDVICQRMEQRMAYGHNEQDMVLLHHEVEVEYPDGQPAEKHQATLLEFGKVENGRSTTAMALTVGIPAAIGALLLLKNKVQTKGVIRPLQPEIYVPALEILESSGIKLVEKVET
ncbi:Lysine-ketoglutarate reductase/saccharopine dehydrogenase1 [Zea mays]|uniref:Lysine-ketoglutarate reductase/saccharopine dehydrogenase1 n=1 Tax=Zea mays TaxID=4577 RepID=A0A1D6QD22_MAIZE|nr:Lysine-ketoglutarate reductase/saccharopine dehydrogenase1 [Zea mays]